MSEANWPMAFPTKIRSAHVVLGNDAGEPRNMNACLVKDVDVAVVLVENVATARILDSW